MRYDIMLPLTGNNFEYLHTICYTQYVYYGFTYIEKLLGKLKRGHF